MSNSNALFKIAAAAAVATGVAIAGYYYFVSSSDDSKNKTKNVSASPSSSNFDSAGKFQPSTLVLPVFDLSIFLNHKNEKIDEYIQECLRMADAFHQYGLIIVRDPRVSEADNQRFLNMMEHYFEGSDGIRDARPEIGYQIGVTGEQIEKARNHCSRYGIYGPNDQPLSPCPPEFDKKWRFFWRTGPQPTITEFPELNVDPVIPPEFPEWSEVMNMWGHKMTEAMFTVATMVADGFHHHGYTMDSNTFTNMMQNGPHLLAPTGSDFRKYQSEGTVLAGYHYDLNFLTIHGKSRFPGLYVWTREGKKMTVNIPDGCLLIQVRL
jgi:isopenicillin N synthase-like dioxygenase